MMNSFKVRKTGAGVFTARSIRAAVACLIALLAAGCRTNPYSADELLKVLKQTGGWTPLPIPDSKFRPGSIIRVTEDGVQWIDDLTSCGFPLDEFEEKSSIPNVTFTKQLEFAASAVVNIKGIKAGPNFSRVSKVRMEITEHGADAIRLLKLRTWMEIPDNRRRISQAFLDELIKPDTYLVTEAFRITKGKYTFYDQTGAAIKIETPVLKDLLEFQPDVKYQVTNDGSLVIEQPVYFAVRKTQGVGVGFETLGGEAVKKEFADAKIEELFLMPGRNDPVYNLEVEPKSSREPLILIPDRECRAKFFISPRSDENILPGLLPTPLLDTISGGKALDLTVTLFCNVSETDTYQQHRIRYDPAKKASNSAEFAFVPKLAAVRDNDGLGKLIFVVDANGMELDILQIDAIVGEPTAGARKMYRPPEKLKLDKILPEEISVPDLIIALGPQAPGAVPVVIRPIEKNLLQKFRDVLKNPTAEYWCFDSGASATDIGNLVGQTYLDLTALAEQQHKALQDVYQRIGADMILSGRSSVLNFKKNDTEKMLGILREKGESLYWRIFCRGHEDLKRVMDALFAFDESRILKRPLRIRMMAADIYAPWQILYPVLASGSKPLVEPKSFWGFRYEIGTLQLVDSAQGRTKTVLGPLQPGEVLFGAWRGKDKTVVTDDVRGRAEFLKEHLEKRVGRGVAYCLSKTDFMKRIEAGPGAIKLILAYGHGSSGTEIIVQTSKGGEQIVIRVDGVAGPYFKFADGKDETLIPDDIDRLARQAQLNALKGQPIVILNACETGTPGAKTANNNGFIGALTRAGARAVFATEAPVWANFAQHFGQDLIDLLLDGNDAQSALLTARLKHLEAWGNPLGLLYSLYGNPGARFKKL
jgi:hypothetical protein